MCIYKFEKFTQWKYEYRILLCEKMKGMLLIFLRVSHFIVLHEGQAVEFI